MKLFSHFFSACLLVVYGCVLLGQNLYARDIEKLEYQQHTTYTYEQMQSCLLRTEVLLRGQADGSLAEQSFVTSMKSKKRFDQQEVRACFWLLEEMEDRKKQRENIALYEELASKLNQMQKITTALLMTKDNMYDLRPWLLQQKDALEKNKHILYQKQAYWENIRTSLKALKDWHTPLAKEHVNTPDDHTFWEYVEHYSTTIDIPPITPIKQGTSIVIDLSDQKSYLYEDGYLAFVTDITSGRDEFPTHPGTYEILEKKRGKWIESPFEESYYKLWVEYWIRISWSGYGFHDTCNTINCWRTEYGKDQNHHKNGSHGCINTPTSAIQHIYERVRIGTKVFVQN